MCLNTASRQVLRRPATDCFTAAANTDALSPHKACAGIGSQLSLVDFSFGHESKHVRRCAAGVPTAATVPAITASSDLRSSSSAGSGPSRAASVAAASELPLWPSLPPLESWKGADSLFGEFAGTEALLGSPSWNPDMAHESFLAPDLDLLHP